MFQFHPKLTTAILVLLLVFCIGAGAQEQTERIRSFDSHITVNPDGTMEVRETIQVTAAGIQIRHGIYRDFPTRYKDRLGNRYSVAFEIVSLERDGNTEPYHTSAISDGVRVYFGSSSQLLDPGDYTYVFTYRTSRQLGFFEDHDELYWNVTGTRWNFPIDLATATVILPPQIHNFVKDMDGYAGYEGQRGKAFTSTRDDEGNPTFRAQHLEGHQGLTIVITWPTGLIAPPNTQQKMQWFLSDNRAMAVGLAGLLLVVLYYLVVWVKVGRDPAAGTIVPLYEPPDNMSAPAMRYLERMGFDEKTFSCAILGLAAKGYLNIEQDESKSYRLHQKKDSSKAMERLAPDEKVVARKLFDDRTTLELSNTHHQLIGDAKKALSMALHTGMEKIYFVTNAGYLWPGALLSVASIVALLIAGSTQIDSGQMAAGGFMIIWLSGWTVGVAGLLHAVIRAWRGVRANGITSDPAAITLTLFSIPFLIGEIIGLSVLCWALSIPVCAIIFLLIGANVLFHHLLKAPTRAGRQLMDRVEGFKMFLSAVDGQRLNTMTTVLPPTRTPELFERFLPYAVALDVENAWAQQFSQVLAAAAAAPGGGHGSSYSPTWYSGAFVAASPVAFASSFSSSFASAVSASASAPGSSSGSSGGGSSGGGGGGGGGGGW